MGAAWSPMLFVSLRWAACHTMQHLPDRLPAPDTERPPLALWLEATRNCLRTGETENNNNDSFQKLFSSFPWPNSLHHLAAVRASASDLTEEEDQAPGASSHCLSTIRLYDQPLVCLRLEGQKRLCLAQISSTLLKQYSYNEIHNRRVALGITCVQCTPAQLELLRRAGAMPVSSRRCGTITLREAERLVKSFLEEITPPKLPDNFAFNVLHECGWGCFGQFIPSRYNSSRAKCIRCSFCHAFFSPNKFIFHCHRPEETGLPKAPSDYRHPDAANFNAWRRHLFLAAPQPPEDLVHAWEDVKAMFNGGNRKRNVHNSEVSSIAMEEELDEEEKEEGKCSPNVPLKQDTSQPAAKQPRLDQTNRTQVPEPDLATGATPTLPLATPGQLPNLPLAGLPFLRDSPNNLNYWSTLFFLNKLTSEHASRNADRLEESTDDEQKPKAKLSHTVEALMQ